MEYSEDAEKFYLNEQNKKKKKKLKEKYGGDFYKPEDSELPPEIENQFLRNIEEFERQHENAEYVGLKYLIGNPAFKKIEQLTESDLPDAINEVLELYEKHSINIDIIEKDEVSDRDFYVFLTEELPDEEVENIRIPGWTLNFIYEEFHPSDKLNSKDAVKDVLLDAVNRYSENGPTYISKNNLLNSEREPISKDKFLNNLYSIFENVGKVIEEDFVFKDFKFGKRNLVNVDFILRYQEKLNRVEKEEVFNFTFELIRSEFGGMDVIRYQLNNGKI